MGRLFFYLFLLLVFSHALIAQNSLVLSADDVIIEIDEDADGFDLWVRAIPSLGSVLLTDSSADPSKEENNYSLRAYDYNPINGDERRMLNGEFLEPSTPLYFLLDSTPESSEYFPEGAFHIYIPYNVTYGYAWSREGQLEIGRNSWINVRTLPLPYADYSQGFTDNPFVLEMEELPLPSTTPSATERSFKEIAESTGGAFRSAKDSEEAGEQIRNYINNLKGPQLDIVFVVDTTVSMKNFMMYVKAHLTEILEDDLNKFSNYRIGFVFYRDYKEEYLTREIGYQFDPERIKQSLQKIEVAGGKDIEEAVHEGLYSALVNFDWVADDNIIVLVGDAPPHSTPVGDVSGDTIYSLSSRKRVKVFAVLLENHDGSVEVRNAEEVDDFNNVLTD